MSPNVRIKRSGYWHNTSHFNLIGLFLLLESGNLFVLISYFLQSTLLHTQLKITLLSPCQMLLISANYIILRYWKRLPVIKSGVTYNELNRALPEHNISIDQEKWHCQLILAALFILGMLN